MATTSPQSQLPQRVLTMPEAAVYLRVSERKLWSMVKAREVPFFRVGKQYRFSLPQLERWILQQADSMFTVQKKALKMGWQMPKMPEIEVFHVKLSVRL